MPLINKFIAKQSAKQRGRMIHERAHWTMAKENNVGGEAEIAKKIRRKHQKTIYKKVRREEREVCVQGGKLINKIKSFPNPFL